MIYWGSELVRCLETTNQSSRSSLKRTDGNEEDSTEQIVIDGFRGEQRTAGWEIGAYAGADGTFDLYDTWK